MAIASGKQDPTTLARENQCDTTFSDHPHPGQYDPCRCIYERGHDGPHYADFGWWKTDAADPMRPGPGA